MIMPHVLNVGLQPSPRFGSGFSNGDYGPGILGWLTAHVRTCSYHSNGTTCSEWRGWRCKTEQVTRNITTHGDMGGSKVHVAHLAHLSLTSLGCSVVSAAPSAPRPAAWFCSKTRRLPWPQPSSPGPKGIMAGREIYARTPITNPHQIFVLTRPAAGIAEALHVALGLRAGTAPPPRR